MTDRLSANMWTCGHVDICGHPKPAQTENNLRTGETPKNPKIALPAYIDILTNLFIPYGNHSDAQTCPHVHICPHVHSYGKGGKHMTTTPATELVGR